MKKQVLKVLVVIAVFLVPLTQMQAEELLTEKIFFDMPEVVTAARHEQKIEEASSVIDVITSEDIANSGAQTLADVLRMAAGVDVRTRYGNVETQKHVDIRGLGGSSEAHRVLLLFNGSPFNWVTHGNFKADESIPLNMIKRIEIIRGPGSAMYGANAFNGVINIITKDTEDVKNAEVSVYGGNYQTKKLETEVAKRSDWGNILVAGRHYDTAGAKIVTDHDSKKADNVYARITSHGFDLTGGLGNSNIESPGWLANKSLQNFTSKQDRFLAAKYNYELNEKMKMTPQAYMTKNNNSIMLNGNYMFLDEHSLGGNVQFDYKFAAQHNLISGIEYKNDEAEYPGQWVGKKREYSYAGFAQEEYNPVKPLLITLGGRVDHNKFYSNLLSPRAAISYKIKENIILKSDYGLAYRAPNFYERFTIIPVGTVWLDGNDKLFPERTNSLNVQMLHQIYPELFYSVTAFQNTIRDLIGYERRGTRPFYGRAIPVAFRVNKEKVQVRGAEAEIRGKVKDLNAYVNYSFQKAKNVITGDELINAPQNKINAGLTAAMFKYLSASITSHYVDIRKSETAVESGIYVTVPKYITSDLKISLVELRQGLKISFLTYNLFNENYQESMDEPAPRRHYEAEVTYAF